MIILCMVIEIFFITLFSNILNQLRNEIVYKITIIHPKSKIFDQIENKYGIDECSICLEKMNKNVSVLHLECDHIFHTTCLDEWIQSSKSNKCVLCKKCNVQLHIETKNL